MSAPELVSYWHKSYDGELYIKHPDITHAAQRIGSLLGMFGREDTVRNIYFGVVDDENESHPLQLGGAIIDTDLSITFWSSPYTEHSEIVAQGRRASVLIGHSHVPHSSLRMKKMTVSAVPPEATATHLAALNVARQKLDLHVRDIEEFEDTVAPKQLYVATPSPDPNMTTMPLSAYRREGDELLWTRSIAYPVTAAMIFGPAGKPA